MWFRTRIFHPQVAPSGLAYLVMTDEHNWRSAYRVAGVVTALLSMLAAPSDVVRYNVEAARLLAADADRFREEAMRATLLYACKPF